MKTLLAIALLALSACAGTTANATTCTAYEASASTVRTGCHAVCDRIPSECPWRRSGVEK